ncbi:MAG: tetratricopeptide repeat-containing sensor histidine kinase [Cyclobacteriaceae bacterium]|nr:tetratricopeptide repeat-containing sensor histidine kinase [Cyclobacteriaceae bacterium]
MTKISAMIFSGKAGLGILFLSLIFFNTVLAQESVSLLDWYREFPRKMEDQTIDQFLVNNENAILSAIEVQDDSARVFLLLEAGMMQADKAFNYELAMDSYLRAMALADSSRVQSGQIFSYLLIARVFKEVGNPEKSLQFLEKASAISNLLKDTSITALILNESGNVHVMANQLDDARKDYEQVLQLMDQLYDPVAKAEALSNLANLYAKENDYNRALDFHKQALSIWRQQRNRLEEANSLNVIGDLYSLMKNDERAYANYKAALEVNLSIDNKEGIAEAYNSIGVYYFNQEKYRESLANLELALSAGRSAQSKNTLRKSYEYLSNSLKESGDFRRALEYKELLMAMNDFILKEENDQKLLDMQSQYALEEKEQALTKLENIRVQREQELAEQKRIQLYLYGILLLAGIILVLIIYLYLSKQKSNKQLQLINARIEEQNIQLQNLNNTKDKFFSIISHDLKGPLNSLTSFSGLLINHFDALSKDDIQKLAKDLDKSLKNLFVLLNNLLEWARSQTGNIDFTRETINIQDVLQQNKELLDAQAAGKSITLLYENTEPLWVEANKPSVNTVVRNLLSNAIKFTPVNGVIKLSATSNNHEVIVSISDTGLGMSKKVIDKLFRLDAKHTTPGTQNEQGTGLGLILCKDFIEKNGGRIWVESEEGKGSVFSFSLSASAKQDVSA